MNNSKKEALSKVSSAFEEAHNFQTTFRKS